MSLAAADILLFIVVLILLWLVLYRIVARVQQWREERRAPPSRPMVVGKSVHPTEDYPDYPDKEN